MKDRIVKTDSEGALFEIRPKQTRRPALPFPLVASPPSAPLQGTPSPDGSWPPSRPFLTPSPSDGFNCRRPTQGPSACTPVASLTIFSWIFSKAYSASCWMRLLASCPTCLSLRGLCNLHLSDRHAKSSTGSWRRDILLLKDSFHLLLLSNKDLNMLEHISCKSTIWWSEFFWQLLEV